MKKRAIAGVLAFALFAGTMAGPSYAAEVQQQENIAIAESETESEAEIESESVAVSDSQIEIETETAEITNYAHTIEAREVIELEQPTVKIGYQNSALVLSWEKVENADSYEVSRYDEKQDDWIVLKDKITDLKYIDSNLKDGKTYKYRVRAVSNSGEGAMTEISAKAYAGPDDVTGVKAVAGECKVELSWTASGNTSGYGIYMKDVATGKVTTVVMDTYGTSYEVTNLQPDKAYAFYVRSYRRVEGTKIYGNMIVSGEATPTIKEIGILTDLKAVAGDRKITLSWNGGENSTETVVYRKDNETGKWNLIASVKTNSYVLYNLEPDVPVTLAVKPKRWVYQQSASGEMTDEVTVVPYKATVPAPTHLKATAGECKVDLTWQASKEATGYGIYMQDVETGKTTTVAMDAYGTSYEITNLAPNRQYIFTVRSYLRVDGKKTYGESAITDAVMPTMKVVGDVSDFKAEAGEHSVTLTWKKGANSTETVVYKKDKSTDKWTLIASAKGDSLTVKNLPSDESVEFCVKPKRWVYQQSTQGSMTDGITTTPYEVIPDVPSSLTAKGWNESVILSWVAAKNATGYKIFTYNKSTGQRKFYASTRSTGCTVSGLTNGQEYSFVVLSYRICGDYTTLSECTAPVTAKAVEIKNGWYTINGKKYYYKDNNYLTSCHKIDGKYYYFDKKTGEMKTGWVYYAGFKFYFDKKTGARVDDVSSIIGKQSSYEIRVNKEKNVVTIYAKDGDNGYIIPVKAMICSTGEATPTGTFYTPNRWRWLSMMGNTWGQWVTQITGDFLFHSVYYWSKDNNDLSVGAYNNLGKTRSHGCIRLKACDAKWIYDNCQLRTKVIINDSNATPFGKPTAYKLEKGHTWDPTDPNMAYKCKQKGCH